MSTLYSNDIYPTEHLDLDSLSVQSYLTIDEQIAYNPLKACMRAYSGNIEYVDVFMAVNNIQDPYNELHVGRVLKVPSANTMATAYRGTKANATSTKNQTTVKLKNVKVTGNKVTF